MERSRPIVRATAVACALFGLAACGDGGDTKAIEKRLEALEGRLATLERGSGSPATPAATDPAASPDVGKPPGTAANRSTLEALRSRRVSFDFEKEDPSRILQLVLDMAEVDRVVSRGAHSIGTPVTLKVEDKSAYDVLEALAARTALRWSVDDGGIVQVWTADEKPGAR